MTNCQRRWPAHVIANASEAIQGQGNTARVALDCFVALLLAMTSLVDCASRFACLRTSFVRNVTRCVTA
jgi:hypothetical protein